MAFDPNLPIDGSLVAAAELRSQFNGLKSLIDAVPTVTNPVVDSTVTLIPTDPASAAVTLSGNELHFNFGIPQGMTGATGADGPQGLQGPPFAAAVVDATNTMPPGSPAYVSAIFDGTYVRFVFDIPQGMPGEVTMLDLNNAISNMLLVSSNQSNGVAELLPTNPNPTLLEVAQKLDELILALRR